MIVPMRREDPAIGAAALGVIPGMTMRGDLGMTSAA